jgi:hypothetical protein
MISLPGVFAIFLGDNLMSCPGALESRLQCQDQVQRLDDKSLGVFFTIFLGDNLVSCPGVLESKLQCQDQVQRLNIRLWQI